MFYTFDILAIKFDDHVRSAIFRRPQWIVLECCLYFSTGKCAHVQTLHFIDNWNLYAYTPKRAKLQNHGSKVSRETIRRFR